MAVRILPQDYLKEKTLIQELPSKTMEVTEPQYIEVQTIPEWVPILLGLALAGAFIVSIYAVSKIK